MPTEIGDYPYYCIPHGGPGGIGMAGSFTVLDTCENNKEYRYINFSINAGSVSGYHIFLDGLRVNVNPIPYDNPTGENSYLMQIPADGNQHAITVQDDQVGFCARTIQYTSSPCDTFCQILDLEVLTPSEKVTTILVRDFDYSPEEVDVLVGQSIRWEWVGEIPHTVTSDAVMGADVFNSDLLGKEATYNLTLNTAGAHPYYCIPHGGPGGIGMAGRINAALACEDDHEMITINFHTFNASSEGYYIYVDGMLINNTPYVYDSRNGLNSREIDLPADGLIHTITVQDASTSFCARSTNYEASNCSSDCDYQDLKYRITPAPEDTVIVFDFDYDPKDIIVESGQDIRFVWEGEIPHTVTSDATSGMTVFNSGLLGQGAEWVLNIEEVGDHPYYCIPHGGPGGLGMSGSISVIEACEDNMVYLDYEFIGSRTTGFYRVMVNGEEQISAQSYSDNPQIFKVEAPADNSQIIIEIIDGNDESCSIMDTILGIDCENPCFLVQADFGKSVMSQSLSVELKDQSSGQIISWDWDFGDGNGSSQQNPSHTYAEKDVYEICLTVEDAEGCSDMYCDKVNFLEGSCEGLFSYSQDGLTLEFYNESQITGTISRLAWDFDDGNIKLNRDTVSHTFAPGIYEVCLLVTSDECNEVYCETIDLTDPCLTLDAVYSYDNQNQNELEVNFVDNSVGEPDSWLWGFGDGTTSTEQHPMHVYSESGKYKVCLLAQNSQTDCSSSICHEITVGTVGISEQKERLHQITIYPNPSSTGSDRIYVKGFEEIDMDKEFQIQIFSMDGRRIQNESTRIADILSIKTELQAGMYYLKIFSYERVYMGAFIVN